MDYERILNICQVIQNDVKDLAMINETMEHGSNVEMKLYDKNNIRTRRVPIVGEVLQDELLITLRENRKGSLLISLDELNSLIKEV